MHDLPVGIMHAPRAPALPGRVCREDLCGLLHRSDSAGSQSGPVGAGAFSPPTDNRSMPESSQDIARPADASAMPLSII